MEKLAVSIKEAADALGVAPSTIRKMVELGQLPATRIGIGKGKFVIARQALVDLVSGEVA
jgi:excisionase family DNA binding protein